MALRVIDGDAPTTPVSGAEVLAEMFEVLDRALPGVPLDDPAGPHLRQLHAILGLRSRIASRRAARTQRCPDRPDGAA